MLRFSNSEKDARPALHGNKARHSEKEGFVMHVIDRTLPWMLEYKTTEDRPCGHRLI